MRAACRGSCCIATLWHNAERCGHCSSRPTNSAISRSGWRSPAAWLRRDGADVRCVDLAKEPLTDAASRRRRSDRLSSADAHGDAARGAGDPRGAGAEPAARICAYGLYAPLNATACDRSAWTRCSAANSRSDLAAFARARQPRRRDRADVRDRTRSASRSPSRRRIGRIPSCSSSCPIAPGCRR